VLPFFGDFFARLYDDATSISAFQKLFGTMSRISIEILVLFGATSVIACAVFSLYMPSNHSYLAFYVTVELSTRGLGLLFKFARLVFAISLCIGLVYMFSSSRFSQEKNFLSEAASQLFTMINPLK
jgi:hypothetical protein